MIILPHVVLLFMLMITDCHADDGEKIEARLPLERAAELLKSNKPTDALAVLSSSPPVHEEMFSYHSIYAQALVQMKQPFESIEHYRLAYLYAGSEPDKERTLLEWAEVYAGMGFNSEAAVYFGVFLRKFPKSNSGERAELGIAEARYRLGEYREALAHFEKSGSSLRAKCGTANTLQSLGKTAEADFIYRELIKNEPEVINSSPDTLFNIAENHRLQGRLNDAKIFFSSVKDDSFKYRSALGLGQIAVKEGRFDEALTSFNTAAESSDRLVRQEALMNRADLFLRMKKYDEAETSLQEVRNSQFYGKQYDTATLQLSRLYRTRGKLNESASVLKSLIYQRTPSSAALDELEVILFEVKDRDRDGFLKLWKRSGHWLLDPSRSASLVMIAQALRKSGKPFLDLCGWLVRYGSEDAKIEGRLLLADFYADMGDTATAGRYLSRRKIDGRGDEVLRITAKTHLAAHEPMKAAQALMAIRGPRDADMLMLLDVVKHLKTGDAVIRYCFQTIKKTGVHPQVAVRFADVLAGAGRTHDALEYYRAAVAAAGAGTGKQAVVPDIEWAQYQISTLTRGPERTAALKAIGTGNNTLGRFAAAELRGVQVRTKIGQVEQ